MDMPETRTFLIDRCRLCRDCLRAVLDAHAFPVVGMAGDLEEAHARLGNGLEPGLILFDYDENEPRALEALPRVRQAATDSARIVLLSCRFSLPKLRRALAAGADTGFGKNVSADSLLHYLQLVMAGEKVFPGELTEALLKGAEPAERACPVEAPMETPDSVPAAPSAPVRATPPVPPSPLSRAAAPPVRPASPAADLTPRERDILTCLVDGNSNKVIARRLDIAEATVKAHLRSLLRKIHAANRLQAVAWAVRRSAPTNGGEPPTLEDEDKGCEAGSL